MTSSSQSKLIFSLSANSLKTMAVIFMILDHSAYYFLSQNTFLALLFHTLGRICAPIMCYFIVQGYIYSKDLKLYAFRLFTFAVISHVPYSLFITKGGVVLFPTSMIFTLFCGFLALWAWNDIKNSFLRVSVILVLIFITTWSDWQIFGVAFILIFGIFNDNKKLQMAAFAVAVAFKILIFTSYDNFNIFSFIPLFGMYLAIPLLLCYNGTKGNSPPFAGKWLFYIIYPAQFLIIIGIKFFLQS